MAKRKAVSKDEIVNIRIGAALKTKAQRLAAKEDRTLSEYIRELLRTKVAEAA